MSRRYKPRGWRNEPHRHALAAKGIKTNHKYFQSKAASLFGDIARSTVDTGSQSAAAQRRKRLLADTRQKEAEQRADVATEPVRKPALTPEEKQRIEQTKQAFGIGGITQNTAWQFWQPRDAVRVLKDLEQRIDEKDKKIATQKRIIANENTSEERRERARADLEALQFDKSEIRDDREEVKRLLAAVQTGGETRKSLARNNPKMRRLLSKQALPRLRKEGRLKVE